MNTKKSQQRLTLFILFCGLLCAFSPVKIAGQKPPVKNVNQKISPVKLPRLFKERVAVLKPKDIILRPDNDLVGIFIIKFVEGSHIRYKKRNFTTGKSQLNSEEFRRLGRLKLSLDQVLEELKKINELVRSYGEKYGFTIASTFANAQSKKDPQAQFREKEKLELVSGEELADLDLYYTIAAKDFNDREIQQKFMNAINESAIIEDVHAAVLAENAAVKSDSLPEHFNLNFQATPDHSSRQLYLNAAPLGIDALHAWGIPGGKGGGIKVIDVEADWQTDHEDFAPADNLFWGNRPLSICSVPSANHGTEVMGVINAPHNGFGVNGIVPDTRYGLSHLCYPFASDNNISVAYAINAAIPALAPGDILLIEQHIPGVESNINCPMPLRLCGQWEFVPMEFYQESFDAIRRATAQGIIVVEAAANGGMDLDAPRYFDRFNPAGRHSGALLVGAGNGGGSNNRLWFSDFGRRVDVQGWGAGVVTLGFGVDESGNRVAISGLGNILREYTDRFGGTSSASPIVAGAVASIQGVRRARSLAPLDGSQLRMLFLRTGTPQGTSTAFENIGPLPNLRGAIESTLGETSRGGGFRGPGSYFIQARHSNKVLNVDFSIFNRTRDGAPTITQFDNYNAQNQKFTIERQVGTDFFTIISHYPGRCMDISGSSASEGEVLQEWSCNGGVNQQFSIIPDGDYYRIIARHSGQCLDIENGSTYNSARVIQFHCNGGENQLFQLIPAS